MEQYHGQPCWFELSTSDVDAAKAFYEPLMGWTVGASEMPDFDYRLAKHGGDAVAGFMSLAALPPGMHAWVARGAERSPLLDAVEQHH